MFRRLSPLFVLIATVSAVLEGDKCGIHGADFLDADFGGAYAVAGPGCSLKMADGSTSDSCFCASVKDGDPFGEWEWHCNTVEFGPIESKICPELIPVPADQRDLDFVPPYCDTSIHPTGLDGDPSCPYDTCDDGGDSSAVCGCVDLNMYGMGDGMRWYCLHSTCSCGTNTTTDSPTGAPTSTTGGTGTTISSPTGSSNPKPGEASSAYSYDINTISLAVFGAAVFLANY